MFLKCTQKIALAFLLLLGVSQPSLSQHISGPLSLHRQPDGGMPIAIYSGVKDQDFKKLIVAAFEQSNFSLVAIEEVSKEKNYQDTLYKFSYSIEFEGKNQTVLVTARSTGDMDRFKRCANCFLRLTQISDQTIAKSMPWMLQYELSSRLFPDIGRAYEKIKASGQKYMDQKSGFNYVNQWRGERNFSTLGNSFTGVEFAALKQEVIQAYGNAGFNYLPERTSEKLPYTNLVFNFPITEGNKEGVVYSVAFFSQLNSIGFCMPCEMTEFYSPYQRLPAVGILGVADRLTLESRFLASRTRAFELLKESTARYLRPRTSFVTPPKPLPLGSPLPPPPPPT